MKTSKLLKTCDLKNCVCCIAAGAHALLIIFSFETSRPYYVLTEVIAESVARG